MLATSKRLILFVLCFMLIVKVDVLSASAESTICMVYDNAEQLSTTVNSNGLTVFGYFGGKSGYPVTVTVKDTVDSTIAYFNQITTEAEGYYSVLIPYETEMLAQNYKITVSCVADDTLYEKTLAYLPGLDPDALLQKINQATTAEAMEVFINQYGLDAGISLSALEEIDQPEAVYEALTNESYDTIEEFQKSFKNELETQEQRNSDVFEIHVSPDGNDTNAATAESPLATIEAALSYANYLMALGSDDNFEILLHGGEYTITKEIVIEKKPEWKNHITIRNYNNEKPVLNGSCSISGWQPYNANIYKAKVPMGLDIDALFENRSMLTMARYPNKQISYENMYNEFLTAESYNNSPKQFVYKAGDLPYVADPENLEVGIFSGGSDGYFMWHMNVIDVQSIDESQRLVKLEESATYAIGTGSHYFWQGDLALLDLPGEFYHNKNIGYVYYYPTDGNLKGKTVSYPVVDNMFKIGNGDGSVISDITIEGIEICGTKRSPKVYTIEGHQNGNGILILNAKNVTVKDCEIHAIGGHGVSSIKDLQDSVISGNHIYDGGQSGIVLTGTGFVKKNNLIDNNYVHHMGQIVHTYAGIYMDSKASDGNVISHNRLHDLKRMGISVGGVQGDNIIEYNDVSDTGNGSDDSGMIYTALTTGVTTIRHNYLHDGYSRGSYRAIYPDEASHNTVVEGNLVARMLGACNQVILAKGDDIQIRNNYLVDCPNSGINLASYMRWESGQHTERMKIENNIFYNSAATMFRHYFIDKSEQRVATSDKNLFYHTTTPLVRFQHSTSENHVTNYTLEEYQEQGYETNSLNTDPLFISSTDADARLSYESPAFGLGVKALELDKMGLRSTFKYSDGDIKPANLFVRGADDTTVGGFINVQVGETVQLCNVVRNSNGFIIPEDAITVTYEIENQNDVVTMNGNDSLTGIKVGVVHMTAKAQTAEGIVESEYDIVVSSKGQENSVVSLQSIVVKNQNNQVVTKVESGTLDVSLSVIPKEDATAKMIVAFVDENGLLQTKGVSENITLTKDALANLSAPISIPENPKGELWVFIWEGFDTLKPLFEKIIVF